jgi:glycosyltransferase involved in cell wall biosynthesis
MNKNKNKIKILYCSKVGIEANNSTGGQLLRVESSLEALKKISTVDIVSRNTRFFDFKNNTLVKKNIFYAPSVRRKIKKIKFIKGIFWRIKEKFYLKKDAEFIVNLYRKKNYSCLWISYASQCVDLIKEIKKIDKNIKIIADTDSVFHSFIQRQIPYVNFFKKIYLKFYFLFYKKIEYEMLKIADVVTAVSEFDAKVFRKLYLKSNIFIFRNVVSKKKIKKRKNKNFNIIISGTFGAKSSPMNISTRWFLKKIYPLIKDKVKNLKIYIIGMYSNKEFKSSKKNNIIVKGWVKNITNFFGLADLAVVPLKYESGTRFKILEAGLYKIPVISTTLGAEGLKYKKNESIIIEDNAKKFANKIIYLYHNKRIRDKLAKNNYKIITCNYSKNILIKDGLKILKKI